MAVSMVVVTPGQHTRKSEVWTTRGRVGADLARGGDRTPCGGRMSEPPAAVS
ncbi:hypothetical protein LX15_003857 [Streptoalloteichus tenebrarius]|uniref:Uncharacterized protein n=1 Tax=Streptoalloteichus tenebrarius (strain ATCC 17920 / DSM 40477 / JCM 4838 / CBS 697.72 / NBRC 16177 / NCIMB 11028 / NRRL B-12390 / A12253. 1 / ISP 5477) TaxID=1933 RepID=A0ABT1HXA1_STRSD|nr:hypothetical protein [Streptoalloteichus tenebrarius]